MFRGLRRLIQGKINRSRARAAERAWERQGETGPVALAVGHEKYVVMTDDFIGKRLYQRGEFDFPKFVAALSVLERESVRLLINVGANVGDVCIPAVVRGRAAKALAFEPDPISFALLKMNCEWNGCSDLVVCRPVAIGEHRGFARLEQPDRGNRGGSRILESFGSKDENEAVIDHLSDVRIVPLDDIGLELTPEDLIFIDIEGHEPQALRGARRTLSSGVPVVLEFSPDVLTKQDIDDIVQDLSPRQRFVDLRDPRAPVRPLAGIREFSERLKSKPKKRQSDILVW